MKILLILALVGATLLGPWSPARGELPRPSVIFYGQALDEYGWPYRQNAEVILRVSDRTLASHTITGPISPGVNFALQVFMDDGQGERCDPAAARAGEPVTIVVKDGLTEKPILQAGALPAIPEAGQIVWIKVTAGTDANGSGIPDTWEQEVVRNSHGFYTNIDQVLGGDDLDGDGMSNRDEYRAGTMAFWDFDYFGVEEWAPWQRLYRARFLSVPGKAYRVSSALDFPAGAWAWRRYARTENGETQAGAFSGDGDWASVFIAPTNTPETVRLSVDD